MPYSAEISRSNPSCFLFLAVRPGGSGQAECADNRRKRNSLQYERDAYYAEREKDDQIPLGKRAAVVQNRRKGECGGKRDYSSHACPPCDEDLAAAWQHLTLMEEPGSHKPGDGCSREHPQHSQQDQKDAENRAV